MIILLLIIICLFDHEYCPHLIMSKQIPTACTMYMKPDQPRILMVFIYTSKRIFYIKFYRTNPFLNKNSHPPSDFAEQNVPDQFLDNTSSLSLVACCPKDLIKSLLTKAFHLPVPNNCFFGFSDSLDFILLLTFELVVLENWFLAGLVPSLTCLYGIAVKQNTCNQRGKRISCQ